MAIAEKLKVKYVVFHACNIKVRESVSYQFSYTDWEVLDQVISIINTLFDEKEYSFQLLFENLWWPGLKLNNKEKQNIFGMEFIITGKDSYWIPVI
ncbi:hypothetical protein HMPREF9466_00541 [Fusobacterium necrophorum subsp. funduliforme 1_1_36S]|nr:hypothetical protein HMPREF9466_00541 [Fusobacterium necrophorum subsp. funduliforme 1_1_36S]